MADVTDVTDVTKETPDPRQRACEVAAWILVAAALFFIIHFRLVAGLVFGLLTSAILHALTDRLHRPRRLSHGMAKVLATLLLGLFAAGLATGAVFLFIGLVRGRIGELPSLLQKLGDTIDVVRVRLVQWGMADLVPERFSDADELQSFLSDWFRTHGEYLRKGAGFAGRFVLNGVIGSLVAALVFFAPHDPEPRPFARALKERLRLFGESFERVLVAQAEIAAVNTVLTAFYLYAVLGFLGSRLPMTGTVVVITFVAGLIPVAGNLISNTVIVLLSLNISPWTAFLSLAFLVTIHKLEYFLNARIVGRRINAAAWETLVAIFAMEAAFGPRGVVLAPVIYAWIKRELTEKDLV